MKKEIRKEWIELFRAAFRGREDTYRADKRVNEPVTDQVVKDHLVGKRRISQYLLSPDILNGEGTHWVVADVDAKPCQEAGVESLDVAIDIVESLAKLGVKAYIERSKGDGHHAMVFFSEPVLARKARALMLQAIDEVERDTGFRVKEVFPIQDNLSSVEYGSCLNLPLYGGDISKGRTVFLNPDDGYKPYRDQWEFLKSIEKVLPDKIDELVESGGIKLRDDPGSSDDDAEEEDNTGYEDMMPCVARMMKGVSEGQRDVVAFVLAIHFRVEKNLPEEITLALMLMWNRRNDPPLPDETIQEKVKKAYHGGKGGRGYKGFKCEDELIHQFCDSSCPIRERKEDPVRKQYFRGKAFVPKKLADELMTEHSFLYSGERLYVYQDGVYIPTGEVLVRRKCREKLGNEARIYRVKEVLAHIVDLTFTETDRLNNHGHLINLKNGMLDWHKEELLPHDEEYLSTIQVPLIYDPNSECPVVDYFFRTTLFQDCIKLMEELFGYILVPDTSMHKSFMLTGQGANGKSTCLNPDSPSVFVERIENRIT